MKLSSNFITQEIDGTQFLVPVGAEAFRGIFRNNSTAAWIIDCLKEETSEEAIIEAMLDTFEATREEIEDDVKKVLSLLRSIHALEE